MSAADKPPRTGPTLAIVGSCEGCEHLARITSDESVRICNYEHTAQPHHRLMTTGAATPSWCPELAPARLALARAIMTEADASAEEAARRWDDLHAADVVAGADITGPARGSGIPSRGETATCGPGPGVSPYQADIKRGKCLMRAYFARRAAEGSAPRRAQEESDK